MDNSTAKLLVQDLEDEVNNGGFHQYFFNTAGDNALDTVLALEHIGASYTASILRAAIAMFPNGFLGHSRDERQELLWSIAPETTEFANLDTQFLEYKEDLAGLSESLAVP